MRETLDRALGVVGRETELAALQAFVAATEFPRALLISGGPGIGKTTLWEAGVAAARERGIRVLSTRASGAEARLTFAALIDLLEGVASEAFAELPAPQMRALQVALLRVEPVGASAEPGAIAFGFLGALRALAAHDRLLVAVDDVQWLDSPSADTLVFASRRLKDDAVGFLLAGRPDRVSGLERALEPRLERLDVGPLSLGAVRRMLSERLGMSLPRQVLRRLLEATLGNPLFALEVGRELNQRGMPAVGEELPVPDRVEDLLGTRVARLRAPVRKVLLAVALSADLRLPQLAAIADAAAVEDAVDAGLLVVEDDRVRAAHPLLAAAVRNHARPRTRRELHGELAHMLVDGELRARHLALAAERPDTTLAATLAEAAEAASSRGARQEAVELAEHALRLTPAGSPGRSRRVLALAEYLALAGGEQRLTELLSAELDLLPSGGPRANAHVLLTRGVVSHIDDCMVHLERALAEGHDDPELRARVLAEKAMAVAVCYVERVFEADSWAREAHALARAVGSPPEVELDVLQALAWTSILRGRPVDDLAERSHELPAGAIYLLGAVDRMVGARLGWRGHVDDARTHFDRLATIADERGEASSYMVLRQHQCELELRAGEWRAASSLLDEWRQSADRDLLVAPSYQRCQALLAAGRGFPDDVEEWTVQVVAGAEASGLRWSLLEALRARGMAALLVHEPNRALESLRSVWGHTESEGVTDPGAFPSAPDLVEALVESGEVDEARAVTARLTELADEQEHPWGLATARRCDALVSLASQADEEVATAKLEEAAAAYRDLGLRFDHARTLLLLGRALRRRKRWAAARRALEQAAAAFDAIDSPGWTEEARTELARVGARRPAAMGLLTPAEQRVVELAVDGLSNKEIARALFVTVNTVETHLSHAFAKLGVRSRAQLARARSPQA